MEIIFTNRLNLVDLDVIECGHQVCEISHVVGPSVRNMYLLHYIHSGKGVFRTAGKEYCLKAGQGFLVRPNILNYYAPDPNDPWVYSWIGFQGVKAEFFLRSAYLDIDPILDFENSEVLGTYFCDMLRVRDLKKGKETTLLGILYNILSYCMENSPMPINKTQNAGNQCKYLDDAIEFIKINYEKDISIKDIAKHLNINEKYLCTIFKNSINASPYHFLLETRFERAIELMKDKQLTISDISRSVGYKDILLFSKMFKRYKGLSPREYRKQLEQ